MSTQTSIFAIVFIATVLGRCGESRPQAGVVPGVPDRAISPEATIADNFRSGDPAKHAEAISLLDDILREAPRKVRRDTQSRWFSPMVRAKAHDQLERIAIPEILSGPEDTARMQAVWLRGSLTKPTIHSLKPR